MFEKVDKKIALISAAICGIFVIWTVLTPETMQEIFNVLFKFFINNLGWLYLLCVSLFLLFCIVLAFSKYGKIKLGKDDEEPEYSNMTWFAMLFSAGMGIGLVFWGAAEPIYHFANSPFAESGSPEAVTIALRTTFFHWGIHPWASYGVIALALGYFQFRKGLPALVSSTLHPLIGDEGINGPIGQTVDIITVVVTLIGVATSLGLGSMQVVTGMNYIFGIPNTMSVSIIFVAIVTLIFTMTAVSGLKRWMKWLSNINMIIAAVVALFILMVGPTVFLLESFTEALGNYLQNVVMLSFFTDAAGVVAEKTGYDWIGSWTVFYWAWWLTWAPFVGSFIARISRGRTIKEFVLGILVAPTILSAIWFTLMGGSAIHLELFGNGGIAEATFNDVTSSVFATFAQYPLSGFLSAMAMIMVTIFFLTSANSATFVIGMFTSRGDLEPSSGLKIVWGVFEGFLAIALLMAGGLSAVQTVSFTVGLPFMILMLFIMYSFLKALNRDQEYINEKSVYTQVLKEKENV
ncbi:glycine betaine transporter [Dethiosulfatibacter aminovorans DSM 17477]|uniref:Glycine betaine transporter n=1 Tax=Dethiosulfatibacter aminovorans DSM 17477 TaxID=1121476 RepID=A0A1M6K9E4_9FIRM|nr:BCCT family transporter [Dethiosulfatibacter aminovorans]SHJ55520.1 glycine betaine transporter [Dethiosulfatibacter aminovorans DSM 17477]